MSKAIRDYWSWLPILMVTLSAPMVILGCLQLESKYGRYSQLVARQLAGSWPI